MNITRKSLTDYLEYMVGPDADSAWTQEESELIAEVLGKDDVVTCLAEITKEGLHSDPIDHLIKLIVFGFQCGREFESRQIVKAMRNGGENEA